MIELLVPADSGLPQGPSALALKRIASPPVNGIPVLILHGPFPMRAAIGLATDDLVVHSLAPLVPSLRVARAEISEIRMEQPHWYALGRPAVCVKRHKGASLRLMAPLVPGTPDGTADLSRLLRAWWLGGRH